VSLRRILLPFIPEAKLDLIKWLIGFLMAGMISLLVKTFF